MSLIARHSPDKSAGLTGMRELPTSLCLDNTHQPFTGGPTPFGGLPIGNYRHTNCVQHSGRALLELLVV